MTIRFSSENADEMRRNLSRLFSDSDECFASLKYLISQISDDPAMLLFPETYEATDSLQNAGSKLFCLKDRVLELCSVMAPVPDHFTDCENRIEERIRMISSQMAVLSACAEAISSGQLPGIFAQNPGEISNDTLSDLLIGDVCSFYQTNLAPIHLALQEKYGKTGETK